VAIRVTVVDGTVTPPPSRVAVPLGSPVALTVTSDVADEIHVHGYELEEPVAAGGSVTIQFTADQAGLFEVETHETEKLLLQLQVS
jgi:heme/copper-type cytochrome/quinol oxidase subunit 2